MNPAGHGTWSCDETEAGRLVFAPGVCDHILYTYATVAIDVWPKQNEKGCLMSKYPYDRIQNIF